MGFFFQYRKIPKISPWAYKLKALFEGLFFGGAYLRREICVSKSIELAFLVGSKYTVFVLFYFVFEGNFPSKSPREGRGGLYLEGRLRLNGGFFALPVCRAHGGAYFRNFTVFPQGRPRSR